MNTEIDARLQTLEERVTELEKALSAFSRRIGTEWWGIPGRRLTLAETAKFLGVSAGTLRNVMNDRLRQPKSRRYSNERHQEFPVMRSEGRSWYIWGPNLRQWIVTMYGSDALFWGRSSANNGPGEPPGGRWGRKT
jgi:uncharacterized coiled-coil protein SlyX